MPSHVHVLEAERFYAAMGTYPPALTVASGDRVRTATPDAHGHGADDRPVTELVNPQVGPIAVAGAAPGDVLAVRLERVWPNRRRGYCNSRIGRHLLDPDVAESLPPERRWVDWDVDPLRGTACVEDAALGIARLTLPLEPMLGCIGVAPADGAEVSTATSGPHGGNMDWRGIRAGVVAYFPVSAPGGLLFLGDGHAVQGDGETNGMGVEISMDVEFTAWVHRTGRPIGWPRAEDADTVAAIGNARPLEEALRHATSELLRWVVADYGLSPRTASLLIGQRGRYQIANVVDPAYTVVCSLEKRFLPTR
jgi:amidase